MCDCFECYFGSVALYSHNRKDVEDVDTCLLSSILASNCVRLISFLSMQMITMKHCDVFRGICLVCHVYAHLVLGCVFVFFWMCGVVVCSGVRSSVPCWSVLQRGMLGLLRVRIVLFCAFVSRRLVMSSPVCAWSLIGRLWLSLYLILSLQIRYCF